MSKDLLFFISNLAASVSTLGHFQGDTFPHLMFITDKCWKFDPESLGASYKGCMPRPSQAPKSIFQNRLTSKYPSPLFCGNIN